MGNQTNDVELFEKWQENQDDLNPHQNGSPTLTLDEVYQKAKSDWLIVRGNAKAYFENKNNSNDFFLWLCRK